MKASQPRQSGKRGAALMTILWIVAILTLAVFSTTQLLFIELESDSSGGAIFRAEQLADRGVAVASHPLVERGDPILLGEISDTESFQVRISSEGDRLNLNTLLENPEADRIVLEELFTRWGLRRDYAVDVVDNLIDWVDADDLPTFEGAEDRFYFERGRRNHPFNRPFRSLEEVELVNQFNLVIDANPEWKQSFTLLSAGPLDLNEAPAELIAVACECGMAAAEAFVDNRNGYDGNPGTDDDYLYENATLALADLGIPEGLIGSIGARVSVNDPSKRIISIGRLGSIAVERSVTVQYNGQQGEITRWTTRRIE